MSNVVDTKGRIARAKARMSSACSVRKSAYADEIISMRLQGNSYKKIEDWLREKGLAHVIPSATICRNLQKAFGKEQDFMPAYEEEAEANGGHIPLDPQRTLAGQAYIQRMRIDYMVRQENDRRKTRVGYSNPRIRQEMETYLQLVEAASRFESESEKAKGQMENVESHLSKEAEEALSQLILDGKITIPSGKKPTLLLVS